MSTKKFVRNTSIRILVLIFLSIFLFSFLAAAGTIITNQIAMGQMENSNELFILHEMYNNAIRPSVIAGFALIVIYNAGAIAFNTYKFIKNKNKENN